jgi:hypothetical protein
MFTTRISVVQRVLTSPGKPLRQNSHTQETRPHLVGSRDGVAMFARDSDERERRA